MLWMLLNFILAVMPVADKQIVWWRTAGGLVIQGDNVCSMVLTQQNDMAIISWDKESIESVAFAAKEPLVDQSAMVRIDDTIIGETNLTSNGIAVLLTARPLDDLLRDATVISGDFAEHPIVIAIDHARMVALLTARDKCRTALR